MYNTQDPKYEQYYKMWGKIQGRPISLEGPDGKSVVRNVPTFVESGFPGFVAYSWNGLMAPAGTRTEVIDRLAKEIARIVRDEKIRELFVRNGLEPVGDTPAEFAQVIATDIKLWTEAVSIMPKTAVPATGR
jgi:tripartite-type tricarboxylate transporter receptor subunit TctC